MIRWVAGIEVVLALLVSSGCMHTLGTKVADPRVDRAPNGSPAPSRLPEPGEVNRTVSKVPAPQPAEGVSKWPDYTNPPRPVEPPPNPTPVVNVGPDPTMRPIDLAPKHPIVMAVECLLDNRHEEAQRHLQNYDPKTQEFLMRILPTLSLVARNNALSPADIAAVDESLKGLRYYLQVNSEFAISKLNFCESIKGYAIYKPLPADHLFVAAQPDRPGELVQLYVEIKNFGSRSNQGLYETLLSSHVEIRDEKGETKWLHRFRPDDLKLVSRTRLGEYYHNYTFPLPSNLPPGSYHLIVVMTDETQPNQPRPAHASVPLRIVDGSR